jgi:hypothetical protein
MLCLYQYLAKVSSLWSVVCLLKNKQNFAIVLSSTPMKPCQDKVHENFLQCFSIDYQKRFTKFLASTRTVPCSSWLVVLCIYWRLSTIVP